MFDDVCIIYVFARLGIAAGVALLRRSLLSRRLRYLLEIKIFLRCCRELPSPRVGGRLYFSSAFLYDPLISSQFCGAKQFTPARTCLGNKRA